MILEVVLVIFLLNQIDLRASHRRHEANLPNPIAHLMW